MSSDRAHRPGILKQKNKSHKSGRHRSKGSITNELKGKTEKRSAPKKRKITLQKHERKHQQSQLKKRKLNESVLVKRSRGVAGTPPFLVVVLPSVQTYDFLDELVKFMDVCDDVTITRSDRSCMVVCERFKQRFEFVQPRTLEGYINAAKLADCLMIGTSLEVMEEEGLDKFASTVIDCIFNQGLSSVVLSCQGLKNIPAKKLSDVKKGVLQMYDERFPEEKLHPLDSSQDALGILRTIGSQKILRLSYREYRPNLYASKVNLVTSSDGSGAKLSLTGYLRGEYMSANQLIHIPGFGSFQISSIAGPSDPHPIVSNSKKQRLGDDHDMEEENVLQRSNPEQQESLQMEEEVDQMANEQTWPTEEELEEAAKRLSMKRVKKRVVPKGFSDYQAEWVNSDDDYDDDDDDDDDEDEDMDDDEEEEDKHNEEGMEYDDGDGLEEGSVGDAAGDTKRVRFNFEMDTMSVANGDVAYDSAFDEVEEKDALKRYKEARQQEMFPDEVDTPDDVDARVRFQKYRGLESFRTCNWDVNEDLPADYEKIIRFKRFKTIKKGILEQLEKERETENKVKTGTYVTITASVQDPSKLESLVTSPEPVVVFGLLPYEQKLTVLHFLIRRRQGDESIIASKEPMVIRVGCHSFKCRPIYSQHSKGPLHKYEKFFSPESTMVASVYAPMIFPPASVLMFKPTREGEKLVGTGTLLSADPDRRIIKRIILSGHPYKINKWSSVIRYMFFNREDIEYFKSIKSLRTKNGYRGDIVGPIGTHGHMKCVFQHQLNSQDVVFMNLYKRVYPKWTDFSVDLS